MPEEDLFDEDRLLLVVDQIANSPTTTELVFPSIESASSDGLSPKRPAETMIAVRPLTRVLDESFLELVAPRNADLRPQLFPLVLDASAKEG